MTDEYIKNQIAKYAARQCEEYLRNPKHRKDFEQWFLKKYGYPWKERYKHRELSGNI